MNSKIDINEELDKLIYKYELDKHYPAYRVSRQASKYLRKLISNLSKEKGVFLFISMDIRALEIIKGWALSDSISTLFVDSVSELESQVEMLKKCKKIYIVSFTRTIEIFHWLWRHDFKAESVYDMMENDNIYPQMEFYRFFTPLVITNELDIYSKSVEKSCDGASLVLYEYYYQKQRLIRSCCEEDSTRLRQKLFFLDLCMKNFIDAERVFNESKNKGHMEKCWNEILQLLNKIKENLNNKKQENIIVYWLDALQYDMALDMKYLQSRNKHSLYFHNAYTVTPYTHPTAKNIFCGITQVDDLGYKQDHIGLDNSSLIKDIIERGYQLKVVGRYFNLYMDSVFSYDTNIEIAAATCSEKLWNMVSQILQNNVKTVYFIHLFAELHPPAISVRREKFEEKYLMDYLDLQRKELDEQLGYYDSMLGDLPYRIYMSDHGAYTDAREIFHIHFQVYHSLWNGRETDKMYCHLDLGKIIHNLMIGKDVDESVWDREFVPIQDVPFYYKPVLDEQFKKKNELLQWRAGYKGAITKDAIYMRFMNGEELFHKWSDAIKGAVFLGNSTQRDIKLCKELSDKVGDFPIELETDPKFKYTKYIHRVSNNVNTTVRAISKLINNKLNTYLDGSIALRMGGEHSIQLYSILTESNRRKIGGIIDSNNNCKCRALEYHIYKVGGALPQNITTVVLSSYRYREELKAEAKQFYNNYEIIDVYSLFEQFGYDFTREFWLGTDSDWDVGFPFD